MFAGDSLGSGSEGDPHPHLNLNGMKFTTFDRDHDEWGKGNCATKHGNDGGWWYRYCAFVNLNGHYKRPENFAKGGILWRFVTGESGSLKSCQMKVRKK